MQPLAVQLGIALLFLPLYSPNLNLIERRWKVTRRRALTIATTRLSGTFNPPSKNFSTLC